MKVLFKELVKSLFMDAIFAFGLSGVLSLIRLLFHGSVTRIQFLGGALVIFILLILDYIYNLVRTVLLMRRDPVFREMTKTTGISWRQYKRMRNG